MSKIVFADTQTYRERDYHVVRINDVRDDSFELRLQEIGGFDGTHGTEHIGYVAFDEDTELFTTMLVDADHTMTNLENIEVNNGNSQPIFADMQSTNDDDSAMVSLGMGDTPTSGKLYIDEDTNGDNEVTHASERVAVAQFNVATTRTISETSAPTIHNWDGDVIGGALAHWVHNSVIYDGSRFTVSLQDYFGDDFDMQDMIVIVGPTQRDDLNFKIVSVDNEAETVIIEVQDFGSYTPPSAGVHGVNLGLLIVESGAHRLSDGTSMFAGTLITDSSGSGRVPIHEPDAIDDNEEIEAISDDIMVFADSQTYDDSEDIVIRMKNVSSDGFEVKLQELEGSNGYHANEVIGYIAFDKTSELFSATHVQTTHVATTAQDISITNATRMPVFADMQSYNGGDAAMVSLKSSGSSSVDGKVYIDEETTRDSETRHVTETVAVAQFLGATVMSYPEVSAPTIENADGEVIGGAMAHWVRNDEIFDGNRITIDLDDYFGDDFDLNNMVAIVGPTVRDDLNFRIIEVDNFDDSLTLEVQDFGDYQQPGAGVWGINLGIMVVEQGVHVLSDGTAMVADKIVTNHDWAQAEFII